MRILLFWQHYPPEELGRALSVRGVAFVKFLRRHGHDVTVIAPGRSKVPPGASESGESIQRHVTYESLRQWFPPVLAILVVPIFLFLLALRVKRLKPDVIIASQPSYTLPIQGLLVARATGAKFVMDIQDIYLQDEVFARGSPWRKPKLLLERFVVNHVDFAFVVLPKMLDELVLSYGMDRQRTVVLYNGFDSDRFPTPVRNSRRSDVELIHAGSPRVYYDSLRLIKAFERICNRRPHTRLVFTDCRENPYVASTRLKVEQLRLDKNVEFRGQLPREELLKLMSEARIGIYSLYPEESSRVLVGTKVFEYFAMGLPVAYLGHPGGSVDDLLLETNAGIVAHDETAFADAVIRLLEDSAKLDCLSSNARLAAERYDWNKTIPPAMDSLFRTCGLIA